MQPTNGLLTPPAQQAPAQDPGMQAQQPMQPQGQPARPQRDYDKNPLNEADAEQLERFNVSAQKLIHSPKTRDSILNRIGVSSNGPIEDMADTIILLVDRIEQQTARDGERLDDAVKIQGANNVAGEIIAVAEASGKVPKLSEDERAVTYSYAVQKYADRMIARGEITREELNRYAQEAAAKMPEEGTAGPTEAVAEASAKADTVKKTMAEKLEGGMP